MIQIIYLPKVKIILCIENAVQNKFKHFFWTLNYQKMSNATTLLLNNCIFIKYTKRVTKKKISYKDTIIFMSLYFNPPTQQNKCINLKPYLVTQNEQ